MPELPPKPTLLFIHQHGYQQRYYRQLIAANKPLFSATLAYYWQPRLPLPTYLSADELEHITSFQRRKLQRRQSHRPFISDALLNLRARYEVAAWLQCFKKTRPNVVVMWNGNNPGYRAATLAAQRLHIETRFLENGPLPNTTTCDPEGVNAASSIPRAASFFEKYAKGIIGTRPTFKPAVRQRSAAALTKTSLPKTTLPENYIFAPFQVHEDSQLLAHSPHIADMHEFYQWLRQAAEQLPYPIVIKEHPSCKRQYDELHLADSNITFANHHETKSLVEQAEAVVTINSTVGLEAAFLGKPVVTLGHAFYGFEPIAFHADTADELTKTLRTIMASGENQQQKSCAKGLRAWLEDEYLVPGNWREAKPKHLLEMAKRLLPIDLIEE